MDGVAPPLKLIWAVRKSLESGESAKQGVHRYLKCEKDNWQELVLRWLSLLQQGRNTDEMLKAQLSPLRQQLLQTIEQGMRGEAILPLIIQLEDEAHYQIEIQVQKKLATLPYLLLIPLALFLFPACALLLLGPLFLGFLSSFG